MSNSDYSFSPGAPASSTTKTGRHDIAEILLKVASKHQKSKRKQNRGKNHAFDYISSLSHPVLLFFL
jgi:hypothetical protein